MKEHVNLIVANVMDKFELTKQLLLLCITERKHFVKHTSTLIN